MRIEHVLLAFAALLLISAAANWRRGRARLNGWGRPRRYVIRAENPTAFGLCVAGEAGLGVLLAVMALADMAD